MKTFLLAFLSLYFAVGMVALAQAFLIRRHTNVKTQGSGSHPLWALLGPTARR